MKPRGWLIVFAIGTGLVLGAFAGAALIIVLQRKVWPSRPVRSVRAVR